MFQSQKALLEVFVTCSLLIEKVGHDPEQNPHLTYRKHIQLRVWYVLKIWTEQHFYGNSYTTSCISNFFKDFEEDPELVKYYRDFIENTMSHDMNKLSGML